MSSAVCLTVRLSFGYLLVMKKVNKKKKYTEREKWLEEWTFTDIALFWCKPQKG